MKEKLRKLVIIFIYIIGAEFLTYFLLFSRSEGAELNVLLITIDTIRPDSLSCYSNKHLKTPRTDSLASKGALFTRAFAHNPVTLPSHVNILLGTTPLFHGVHENSKSRVAEEFLNLAEYLKARGYSTGAFIGAFPLDSRFGLNQGFDVYDDSYPSRASYGFPPERRAETVVRSSLDWLEKQSSKWFCWIHLWDPHAPYSPPEPFLSTYKDDPYSGEVAYVDSELGKLFDHLESAHLTEKTLIILTGDHGESLGEHGELTHSYFAYNSTLWVPLIIACPGIKPIRIIDYVSHIDIFPTICEILSAKKPPFLQGASLLPLMKGRKVKTRAIYFESLEPYLNRGCAPLVGLIENKNKYMESPIPELYDLENDFEETTNLAPKMDLGEYKKKLKRTKEDYSSSRKGLSVRMADRETQQKLRSLGYIVSPVAQLKESYGLEDDLKTVLPFQQKLDRAIILGSGGKVEESIRLLEEIIQEKKGFTEAYFYLAHLYNSRGQKDEALKVMEEAFQNNPENYSIVSAYGFALVKEGKLDRGIEILQKAIRILDFDLEVWDHLGIAYWRKGDNQKALEHYQKALSLDNSNALVISNLGALYLSIFMKNEQVKALSQATEYFKKAIELEPSLTLAYRGLGVALRMGGKRDEAIACWEKANEIDPKDDFFVYNLGIAYLEKGEKERALEYFEKYLSLKNDTFSPEERRKIEALIEKCKKE